MPITNRAMKTLETNDSVWYRIACDCMDGSHDLIIELEKDDRFDMVFINFYKQLNWSAYWGCNNWFSSQWKKLKAIYRIIFWGYIEIEESIIFRDKEHIGSLITAIKEGQNKLTN